MTVAAAPWQPKTGDPILDLIETSIMNEINDTHSSYFLPKLILEQGHFSSFHVDSWDLGVIPGDDVHNAANAICAIYVALNCKDCGPFDTPTGIAIPGTQPALRLSDLTVSGLANIKMTQVNITGNGRTEFEGLGQFSQYPANTIPNMPAAITLQGKFTLSLSCCRSADGSPNVCQPGSDEQDQAVGTMTATLTGVSGANRATITAQDNKLPPRLSATVHAIQIACDFNQTPMRFDLVLTNIPEDHRKELSDQVSKIFQVPYTQSRLLDKINERLGQQDILNDFSKIVQDNLNRVVQTFFQ